MALDGVSLRVQPGEVVSVLGANGAGKTTMTRVITGLLPASSGEVRMSGAVLSSLPPHRRLGHGVACCPEGRRIFGELTVHENLMLGGFTLASAEREARAEELCALFPVLNERRMQRAGTLSGGQQQLLAMARALMSKPRLLILDEASLGLSPFRWTPSSRRSPTSGRRHVGAAHRAERPPQPVHRRPRLRARPRPHHLRGPARELDDPKRLSEAYFGAAR